MKFLLPVVLLLLAIYLTPLYPVYAQTTTNVAPAPATNSAKTPLRDALKEKMETRKENIASRAAILKERLAKFKDQLKAKRVEKINENLEKINKRRVEAWRRHLERLNSLLTKIEDKVNNAEGKDMTKAKSAISSARTAIDAAEAAVDAQEQKDYTILVNDETTVREDAQKARDLLHKDVKAVHDLFVTARKALAEAISNAVSSIKGGTNNGQQ